MTRIEDFRRYLEEGNVIEELSRAMSNLKSHYSSYEDPLVGIVRFLGGDLKENVDKLLRKNQDLHAQAIRLRQELNILTGLKQ